MGKYRLTQRFAWFLSKWAKRLSWKETAVARQIRKHKELMLNGFEANGELSSGIVEGVNNKAKLTTRKAYGYKSPNVLKTALYHALGDLPVLPVPKSTHTFV